VDPALAELLAIHGKPSQPPGPSLRSEGLAHAEKPAEAHITAAVDREAVFTHVAVPRSGSGSTLISGAGAPPPRDETLRVSTKKLGALMSQVGELLAARMRTDQRLAELRELLLGEEELLERQSSLRALLRQREPGEPNGVSRQLSSTLASVSEHQKELVRRLRELVRGFESDALQSTILSGELQEDIRRIQTFPLSQVLDPVPRTVRNMARDAGKQVELQIEGAEIELDKKVLESLRDPLHHALRNAVDHGVERPEARIEAGKPSHGKVAIRAEHRGESVVITVQDDGPGVDFDAIRRRAIERGLLSFEQARELPEPRLIELLFEPGFTTRSKADRFSGRGVGLDVVRTNVEQLRGSVTLDSSPGAGTTVTIILPLTIYVVHSLILGVGDARFAIPISSIERILRLRPSEVLKVEQSDAVVVGGRPIAVMPLASLLGLPALPVERREWITVIVVGAAEMQCALAVDEIVGDETVLAKNLEAPLVRVKNIAGASVLGDGSVILMLNPLDLLRAASLREAEGRGLGVHEARERPPRLLLADDSFTTRSLERSVLELAGFEVMAVADGREALRALEERPFDVLVSDVDMPHLSGLELCRRLRAEERFRSLPVVLVTSLGSDQDRRKGLEVGADAYIVKSEFDHEKLVAVVNGLIGRP
jgi:two-component system, chemotaxis family, sensor kinase CheA